MLPPLYQKIFSTHLTPSQYLTLEVLVLLLQSYRNVSLSRLAEVFPQPIKYTSRVRNLQRFLNLPQLSAKLLWFPVVKQLLKQEFRPQAQNRFFRRRARKLKLVHQGYLLLIIDRTQWQERNLIMLSLAWGTHAIPIYWQFLKRKGNSSFRQQKQVLFPVLRWLHSYPVLVLGDREFHSVQLGKWLETKNVDFALRQKKGTCFLDDQAVSTALKDLEIQPGMSQFHEQMIWTQSHQVKGFNLAIYWRRKYRKKVQKEPWYILTTLPTQKLTLSLYAARWSIETLFRDCKTRGYNLEKSKVNERRLIGLILLITIAYTLANFQGELVKKLRTTEYVGRPTEKQRSIPRHSYLGMGLNCLAYLQALTIWSDLAHRLMALKPHKSLDFQRGLKAVSTLQSAL